MKKTVCFLLVLTVFLSAVLLSSSVAGLFGDVNDDGEVNNKDVVTLFRLLSADTAGKLPEKYDINGDGSVDNKDVAVLFRQVSGEFIDMETPDKTLSLNSVEYDEKGNGAVFSDPGFLSKLSSYSNKLFVMSAADKEENYTVSPLSAYMALAVLNAVGDEGVHSDIEELFGMNQSDIEKTGALFLSLIDEYSFEGQLISKLDLTNSVWIDSRRTANQSALDMLAEKLFCYAHSTPFSTDIDEANRAIKEFIADKTRGLIDCDFDLDPDTVFAIINTLYLKDAWGDEELITENRKFYKNGKGDEKEFLLTEYIPGEAAETKTAYYFSVRTGSGYKLKLILPKEGCTLKDAMSEGSLNEINARKNYRVDHKDGNERYTRCIFPKFRIESETEMKELLESNGYLGNAFSGYTSNLLEGSFAVSRIIHKAVVNVDEKGVEGAAVTIILNKETAIMNPDEKYCKDFVLDREFGFMITTYNDVILFEGTVVDP